MLTHRPWTLLAWVSIAVLLVVFAAQSALLPLMPDCQLRRLTGFSCPGCGGRRAIQLLSRGEWWWALRMNALLVMGGLLAAVFVLRQVMGEWGWATKNVSWKRWHTVVVISAVIGFGIVRNIPMEPFCWLSPVP
jgi:hypothetical protein